MTTELKTTKIKFLYSYAGKILPRQTDGKLRYVGGFTRVLAVDRSLTFSELVMKFRESCGSVMNVRCKLPSEDLDVLISVTSDEDLASVIEEYDRVSLCMDKDLKIRAILSPVKLLKQASPILPNVSSVNSINSSCSSKSPPRKVAGVCFAHQQASSNLGYSSRICSLAGKYTVRFEKDGRTIRYHHCREQECHTNSYFLPYRNH